MRLLYLRQKHQSALLLRSFLRRKGLWVLQHHRCRKALLDRLHRSCLRQMDQWLRKDP